MARSQLTFADVNLTVTVPAGTRVIEISDRIHSGIVYGCREGDCGTCLMKVVEGRATLADLTPPVRSWVEEGGRSGSFSIVFSTRRN